MDSLFGTEFDWVRHLLGGLHLIFWPVGFAIAVAVTIHVLLTKRDVGSAVGWAGLAWLSPFVGGFLYFILGINRVRRRARKLRGNADSPDEAAAEAAARPDNHLTPLETAARTITRRPALAGNAIATFIDGDEAYPAMLAAIADAKTSVALSTYIMRDDQVGGQFVEALSAAVKRGVAVRVLLDGIGSGYFRCPAATHLEAERVPVRRFMHSPLPWRMPFLNLRTHKKVLVVDGRIGFTGGMNIAYQNLVSRNPPHPVRDTHFRVVGPVVGQLMEAFAEDWNFASSETLEGDAWFPEIPEVKDEPVGTARIVTSGPDADLEKIEMIVLNALACARRSVLLMTPYFLPEDRLVTSLALAAMRGVTVDIVIPEKSDHRLLDFATRANVGPLLDQGCRLWRNGPTFDHSKLLVLDGEWCLVGSQNWDMRSFRLNFELNMEVYHSDLATTLETHINGRKKGEITKQEIEGRSLPMRIRDAALRLMLPYL